MALNATEFDPKEVPLSRVILKFLKDGEQKLDVGKFKNVTLVLGFTGSGKSTLTQFVTSNDEGLSAEENGIDTGEFTITDKNNNVCRGTIESCTIYPTLYVDQETKDGYYDCPGYGDDRGPKHDISVTYFIKKVIDSVDGVKLLFTVNYPSVRQGVDRQNFMLLVKNVINMVKDLEKFKDAIALVVTKVDNQYIVKKGQATLVPDRAIIANIVKFLEGAKRALSAKLLQDEPDSFHRKAIKFIDILLEQNGDDYKKIGLFRRPDAEGKLKEIPLLKSGKEQLDKLLRDNIRYVSKTAQDFGYTLSADSLNSMHSLVSNITQDLALNFRSLAAPIQQHYCAQEKESQNIDELAQNFTQGYEKLLTIKETKTHSSPTDLMNEIHHLATADNIQLSSEIMENISHYDQFLKFLNLISGLTTTPLQWLQGLNEVVDKMNASRNWFDLLINVKKALFKYDILNEVRRNQTAADVLRDQIVSYEKSGIDQDLATSLPEFLRQVLKEDFDRVYGKIRSIHEVTVDEWKLLKSLVNFRVVSVCEAQAVQSSDYPLFHFKPPTFMLMGQYIKLSDINPEGSEAACLNKRINIFALRKVFIDVDLIRTGDKMELVIMAPSWEVVGSPKIILDGSRGQDYHPTKAGDGYMTYFNGRHGHDGASGGDGGAGGFFWGIGQDCINCQHLTITANGGKGGDGQDGGDGARGMDYYNEYSGDQDGVLITIVYNTKVWDKVRIGQSGGSGGAGGQGGSGGPKGTIRFTMLSKGMTPKISAIHGYGGRGGAGGAPGEGGRSDRVIQRVRAILIIPWEKNEVQSLPSGPRGSWGENGLTPWAIRGSPTQYPSPLITLANFTQLLQFKIFKGPTDTTTRLFMENLANTKIEDLDNHRRRRSARGIDQPDTIAKMPITNHANMDRPYRESITTINWLTQEKITSPAITKTTSFNRMGRGSHKTVHVSQLSSPRRESPLTERNFSPMNVESNLLLLDYLVRMNLGGKRESKRRHHEIVDDDQAHHMAYSAYSPKGNQPV